MVRIAIQYQGSLSFEATHEPSGGTLTTDAPVDNHGLGRTFSPTDLLATALGTCVGTLIGIYAERHGLDLSGMTLDVEKHMQLEPRRIGRLPVNVHIPIDLEERHRQGLARVAEHCPVKQSLHQDIEIPIVFHFPAGNA